MGRPEDVRDLTKQGRTPSEIAADLGGLNIKSVKGYLSRAIGEGYIRWSDVFFNIEATPENDRATDDRSIYEDLLQDRVAWGDLYGVLADLEIGLHERIRTTLVEHYGERDWWLHGIPDDVRNACVDLHRRFPEGSRLSPYHCTTFRDLIDIILDQWEVFREALPSSLGSDVRDLKDRLQRANRIRNRTMHPVCFEPPTAIELDFVRRLRDQLVRSAWDLSTPQYVYAGGRTWTRLLDSRDWGLDD